LHYQELASFGFLQAIDGRDAGMVEGGQDPRLALETGQPLGILGKGLGQDLDRDLATELAVLGPVDLAHPALAELVGDVVVRQIRSDHRC